MEREALGLDALPGPGTWAGISVSMVVFELGTIWPMR
jgi:hypothetical protein